MSDFDDAQFELSPADVVRDHLRQIIAAGQELTVDQAHQFALHAAKSTRTIYRWAAEARTPVPKATGNVLQLLDAHGASAFRFDDVAVSLYYLCGGNMRRLRKELLAAGYPMPSEATLSRRLHRQVPKFVRDGSRTGHRNRHASALHIRHTAANSNDVFEVDEFTLDVHVADGSRVIRPRLLLLIDDKSRFIVAWALLRTAATGTDVLALFADAFEVRAADDGSGRLIGGRPGVLTTDQGSAFRAGPVEVAFASLRTEYRPAPGYTPVAKGKIERAGRQVQAEIVTGLAGRLSSLETRDRRDLLEVRSEQLLTFPQLLDRTAQTIYRLNYDTPHSGLGGALRIDVYDDGIERRDVAEDALAAMYMTHHRNSGTRKVHADGLHVDGRYFVDECLHFHIGKDVTVRVLHHRRGRVAVYDGLAFVGFASESTTLTEAQRRAIMASRRADTQAVSRHAKATRAASVRHNHNLAVGGSGNLVDAYIDAHDIPEEGDAPPPARRVAPTGLNGRVKPGPTTPTRVTKSDAAEAFRKAMGVTDPDSDAEGPT